MATKRANQKTLKKAVGAKTTAARSSSNTGVASVVTKNLSNGRRSAGKLLNGIWAAPALPFVAGGIAIAVAIRYAYKYYASHPEIGEYVGETFDSVETKLKDYKNNLVSAADSEQDSAH